MPPAKTLKLMLADISFLRYLLRSTQPQHGTIGLTRLMALQLHGLVYVVPRMGEKSRYALTPKGRKVAQFDDPQGALAQYDRMDWALKSHGWLNPKGGIAQQSSGLRMDLTFQGGDTWDWSVSLQGNTWSGSMEIDDWEQCKLPTPDEAVLQLQQNTQGEVAA